MVVLDGNFALGCGPGTDYSEIHIFQCMLDRRDAITNEVLEPIMCVLAYPTVIARNKSWRIREGIICWASILSLIFGTSGTAESSIYTPKLNGPQGY